MNKLQGYKDEVVGILKENVGHYLGYKSMETEGASLKRRGELEVRQAFGSLEYGKMRRALNREIVEPHNLRHPKQINDRSSPIIDRSVRVKRFTRRQLVMDADLELKARSLRHVQTVDKSRPIIQQGIRIKRFSRPYLADIRGQSYILRHVTNQRDRSAPFLEKHTHYSTGSNFQGYRDSVVGTLKQSVGFLVGNKKWETSGASLRWRGEQELRLARGDIPFSDIRHKLNREIVAGINLRHPQKISDRSHPDIDKSVVVSRVTPQKMSTVYVELAKAKRRLHHVVTDDRSFPMLKPIERIVEPQLQSNLAKEITQGKPLKHVSVMHDASAPRIDQSITSANILPTSRV